MHIPLHTLFIISHNLDLYVLKNQHFIIYVNTLQIRKVEKNKSKNNIIKQKYSTCNYTGGFHQDNKDK